MKKILYLLLAVLPTLAWAQTETDGWHDTGAAKRYATQRLTQLTQTDSATQAFLVGEMAPFSGFEVLSAESVPEGVRVNLWLDRTFNGTIGPRRFNTTMLLVAPDSCLRQSSFVLSEAQEVDNPWTYTRALVKLCGMTDDSLGHVAAGSLADVYRDCHSYYQTQLKSLDLTNAENATSQLERLQMIQRECGEFLTLRSQAESNHTQILADYGGTTFSAALNAYKNYQSQCSMQFDPREGRACVNRLSNLCHVQRSFIQYANVFAQTYQKNLQMDSTFSVSLGAEALGEYKSFYLKYDQAFDPEHDSASVERIQELARLQSDYVRFIELRSQLVENNTILEARVEKPYAKMMSDYKKFYSLLNTKMTNPVETNTRLQKAVENQECYKHCISMYEHTLQQHDLMTEKVEKPCKDVIKVYKAYHKANKPVYSGSITVYDRQLNQLAAMQRAFQHMSDLRMQVESKNTAIDMLSERWNKPVIKAYESVFEVLNLEVTPDTTGSIKYLEGIIDMQDSCISYIHRYRKIMENNDVINNQKSKAKHIVKAYEAYYEETDISWEAKKDCYKKLDRMAAVQKVFLDALQRDDVEALDKSIKAMKKPSFATILNTLQ